MVTRECETSHAKMGQPPGKDYTRWQELKSEMSDLIDAWSHLYSLVEADDDTE